MSSWLRAGSLSLGTSDVWVRGAWLWGLLGIVGAGWSSTPEAKCRVSLTHRGQGQCGCGCPGKSSNPAWDQEFIVSSFGQ